MTRERHQGALMAEITLKQEAVPLAGQARTAYEAAAAGMLVLRSLLAEAISGGEDIAASLRDLQRHARAVTAAEERARAEIVAAGLENSPQSTAQDLVNGARGLMDVTSTIGQSLERSEARIEGDWNGPLRRESEDLEPAITSAGNVATAAGTMHTKYTEAAHAAEAHKNTLARTL